MELEAVTAFERFKDLGYKTSFVGKWHLGARPNTSGNGNRPNLQGVDYFFGILAGSRNKILGSFGNNAFLAANHPAIALREIDKELETDIIVEDSYLDRGHIIHALGEKARSELDRLSNDKFMMTFSFLVPHAGNNETDYADAPELNIAPSSGINNRDYFQAVFAMDQEIGMLIDKLESLGIREKTNIVFVNDNGGGASADNSSLNDPFRGVKGEVYEGGIRVAMIMSGPSFPRNGLVSHPVSLWDITPTMIDAVGGNDFSGFDGVSLIPTANNENIVPHDYLIQRYNGDNYAVRQGRYKAVHDSGGTNTWELYDLSTDISETTDLSLTNPTKMAELISLFEDFEQDLEN